MAPAVKTALVRGIFPGLRCGRLLRLVVWARLKSEVEAQILAGAGLTAGRIADWRRLQLKSKRNKPMPPLVLQLVKLAF
ncbi:hypothetical protein MUDAN_DOGOELCO_00849 [Lactiplantibacillus mudanjiangensis]|nr:hypothetical protein MUDAN_DOGOELCO_00849 [Lactiplantibacillus mudanjiangensis]